MRTRLALPILMGALMLAAPSALAFEETRAGGSVPPAAAPQEAPAESKGLQLELGGTGTSVAPGGTEVRIPGLGKLGILPKLDFGLELLYGVNEQSFDDRRMAPADKSDDSLGVRGTLRHRF